MSSVFKVPVGATSPRCASVLFESDNFFVATSGLVRVNFFHLVKKRRSCQNSSYISQKDCAFGSELPGFLGRVI